MEDTARLRTKIRLDLDDVRIRIEEMEEIVRTNRSKENQEELKRLIEYEKKLKNQYEKLTGLSIDQATSLKGAKKTKINIDWKMRLFGAVTGLIIVYTYLNIILYSIRGNHSIMDLVSFIQGNGHSVGNINNLFTNLVWGDTFFIVVGSLLFSTILGVVYSFTFKLKPDFLMYFNMVAFVVIPLFLIAILSVPREIEQKYYTFTSSLIIFAVLFVVMGILLIISALGQRSRINMGLGIISGLIMFYSAFLVYMDSTATDISANVTYNWPFYFAQMAYFGGLIIVQSIFYKLPDDFK